MTAGLSGRLQASLGAAYTIEREIGRGGMATVYLAHDRKHARRVALKAMRPELVHGTGGAAERFLREIRLTAGLSHPNILPLLDSGDADGVPFYVMPFVEGESLRARLARERQLPIDDALRIAITVADALAYAHEHGVIHRDIKPENILLTARHALVADFGVAKALSSTRDGGALLNQGSTEVGVAIGTPAYMSLEQASGDAQVDGRSDVYSLGAVLYEMLAGTPPFTGSSTQAIIVRRFVDQVPPLRLSRETVPEAVEHAVARAMAKSPADRFPTAAEFARCLETILASGTATTLGGGGGGTSGGAPVSAAAVAAAAAGGGAGVAPAITLTPPRPSTAMPWAGRRGASPTPDGGSGAYGAVPPPLRTPSPATGTGAAAAMPSIAVLPFSNLSPDPENEYFAAGMTEEIVNALAQLRTLRVAARMSAYAFKGKNPEPRTVGHALSVGYVLEGSVRKAGNRLRITVQLVSTADGYQLWSERYDRELRDVFEIQDEIAAAIVETLKVQLLGRAEAEAEAERQHAADAAAAAAAALAATAPAAAGRRQVDSLEAYELYLKGRFFSLQRGPTLKQSVACFERAVELEPGFAAAYAGMADAYNLLASDATLPPRVAYPLAREAARKALALDAMLADAHAALAIISLMYDWDREAAVREAERAIALDPFYVYGHTRRGLALTMLGRAAEGVACGRRAMELDPLSPLARFTLTIILWYAGDYEATVAEARKLTEVLPGMHDAHLMMSYGYGAMGWLDESVAAARRSVEISRRNPNALAALTEALARVAPRSAAAREEAVALLTELRDRSATEYVPWTLISRACLILGEQDAAFDCLEQAYAARDYWVVSLAVDPEWKRLADDPRLVEILRKAGLGS